MADQHRYTGSDDSDADSGRVPLTARQRRARMLVILLVIAVLIAFIVLHLTGAVGRGTMG
jgi:hypothetical protein